MGKALIIIDIQNFYFDQNGLSGNVEASLKAQALLNYFREKRLPVFHVEHIGKQKDEMTEEEKLAVQIHENVKPIAGETIISKTTPGSFNRTNLLEKLKEANVSELVICGMMSNMCVDTTIREAFDLGFKCTAIHDACATKAYSFNGTTVPAEYMHAAAMASMAFAFAEVKSTDEYLSEK